jgi:hypothetical protein
MGKLQQQAANAAGCRGNEYPVVGDKGGGPCEGKRGAPVGKQRNRDAKWKARRDGKGIGGVDDNLVGVATESPCGGHDPAPKQRGINSIAKRHDLPLNAVTQHKR